MTPAVYGPSATMHAPVSVAKSNISSGLILSRTYVIASPSVSRPSASVLLISTVVLLRDRLRIDRERLRSDHGGGLVDQVARVVDCRGDRLAARDRREECLGLTGRGLLALEIRSDREALE